MRSRCEVIPVRSRRCIAPRRLSGTPRSHAVRARWGGPIALFVGRLVPYKGVEFLLRSLAGSRRGRGDRRRRPAPRRSLEALSKSLGVDVAHLLSGCGRRRRRWRRGMAACDLFVLPSVTRAEAFGLVQLEAMARGKPVISTRLPTGVPWVNVDGITGLTVPPGDSRRAGRGAATTGRRRGVAAPDGRGGARALRHRVHARHDDRPHRRDVQRHRAGTDRRAAAGHEARVRCAVVGRRPGHVGPGVGRGRDRHQARGRRPGVLPPGRGSVRTVRSSRC